jgi:hypothetical protein
MRSFSEVSDNQIKQLVFFRQACGEELSKPQYVVVFLPSDIKIMYLIPNGKRIK